MRVKVNRKQNINELNITLQVILSHLQDAGVDAVEHCNIYLKPLKPSGDEKSFEPLQTELFDIVPEPPKGTRTSGGRGRSYQRKK